MEDHPIRAEPLGHDRNHNCYWLFPGDRRIFIQIPASNVTDGKFSMHAKPPSSSSSSSSSSITSPVPALVTIMDSPQTDMSINVISKHRMDVEKCLWSYYDAVDAKNIRDSLDTRGIRERSLKRNLEFHFHDDFRALEGKAKSWVDKWQGLSEEQVCIY